MCRGVLCELQWYWLAQVVQIDRPTNMASASASLDSIEGAEEHEDAADCDSRQAQRAVVSSNRYEKIVMSRGDYF